LTIGLNNISDIMEQRSGHVMTVEGELHAPIATVQLVRFHFPEPIDNVLHNKDRYRVDLCLTPRPGNARARYPDRQGARHFERLGKVFVVPPGEAMQAVSDGCCQQASVICEFNPRSMSAALDTDLEWTDQGLQAGLDIRERNIQSLLQRLAEEARHPGFASETLVELIAAQLAIELFRYGRSINDRPPGRGLASWRLRLLEERLQDVREPPTLTELARLCRLSVRQLTRGFRASRGCSIGDYVADIRVEKARQLLAGEQSVKAIAYGLGFASPSSFCFAFRRATGETPTQFRQGLRRSH
jgi:AraC family transcriptional regulator